MIFVGNVLNGKHGARSETLPPENILWLFENQSAKLSECEYRDKIEEKREISWPRLVHFGGF